MPPTGRTFLAQEVLNICISIQKQTDVVVFYLSVNFSSFNFRFMSALIPRLNERELLTSACSIQNFPQLFQTVNAKELRAKALRDHSDSENVSYVGGGADCKGAVFICNKQTDPLTHIQTLNFTLRTADMQE